PPRRRPAADREHGLAARPVLVGVRAEVPRPAEPEPELLAELAAERLLRRLALLDEAAGQVPRAGPRRPRAAREEHPVAADERGHGRRSRVAVVGPPAPATDAAGPTRLATGEEPRPAHEADAREHGP